MAADHPPRGPGDEAAEEAPGDEGLRGGVDGGRSPGVPQGEVRKTQARALEPGPEEVGVRVMPTSAVTQPRFFLEPSSKTGSWILQSETVKLPKSGRFYSMGFSPKGQTGKLWLSIETKESFTAMNLLQFPI